MIKAKTFRHVSFCVLCTAFFAFAGVFSFILGSKAYVDNVNRQVEAKKKQIMENTVFHNGISVNGVDLGGLSMDEAFAALAPIEEAFLAEIELFVTHEDASVVLTSTDFEISFTTAAVLEEAMLLAKEGDPELITQQINDIAERGVEYEIDYSINIVEDILSSKADWLAERINREPEDAYLVPNPASVHVAEDAYDGIENPELLEDYISPDRFLYFEGSEGLVVQRDELISMIATMVEARDYGTIDVPVSSTPPAKNIEDIMDTVVLRSSFKSSYASGSYGNPARIYNVQKACDLVNGTVLPPRSEDDDSTDHVFSTNDTLGYRTLEAGWMLAPGYIDGGANTEDSPGGGVCHVSSTLYNAVVKADLEIIYRINHSRRVGYVDGGLDATIDSGRIDFVWSNNTQSNIYVFMWVDKKTKNVCAEIYGEPFPDEFDSIRFYGELVEDIPIGETVYVQTSSLSAPHWYIFNQALQGSKYSSYKAYYKDGKLVKGPFLVADSEYRMHPLRIYVWKGFDPLVDVLDPEFKVPKPEK